MAYLIEHENLFVLIMAILIIGLLLFRISLHMKRNRIKRQERQLE